MIWGNHFLDIYNCLEQQTAYQANKPLAHSQSRAQLQKAGHGFHPHTSGFEKPEPFLISPGSQTRAIYPWATTSRVPFKESLVLFEKRLKNVVKHNKHMD
jgi:hypothetical protein